jgi:hypothetical protein
VDLPPEVLELLALKSTSPSLSLLLGLPRELNRLKEEAFSRPPLLLLLLLLLLPIENEEGERGLCVSWNCARLTGVSPCVSSCCLIFFSAAAAKALALVMHVACILFSLSIFASRRSFAAEARA